MNCRWVREKRRYEGQFQGFWLSTWKNGIAINWLWKLKEENHNVGLGQVFKVWMSSWPWIYDSEVQVGDPDWNYHYVKTVCS